jgi:hypothetical protein
MIDKVRSMGMGIARSVKRAAGYSEPAPRQQSISGSARPVTGSQAGKPTHATLPADLRRGVGLADIRVLAFRIRADDQQIAACRLALMRDAGRDHDDISGAQLNRGTVLAAEPDPGGAAGNAEHLVRGAVIMMMPVYPVAPRLGPAMRLEHCLAARREIALAAERPAIKHQRQRRVVRYSAVIGEEMGFDIGR